MSAKFAPTYANLFMERWEEEYLYLDKNPISEHIMIYKRYIDNCIILWRGTEKFFLDFITYINSQKNQKTL